MQSKVRSLIVALVMTALFLGSSAGSARAIDAWGCATAPASPVASTAPTATPVAFPDDPGELTVFAAASLTDAFDEIKSTLESDHPGLTITYNFAGSQALVTQLTEGAPADVAAFAATEPMDAAIEAGVIAGEPQTFVFNRLTVVVPSDNPAGIASPADLAGEGVKLVLAAEDVPAGRYARESVCLMAGDAATYGDDFVARVAANVVSEEDNVRSVLAKVELGEADAGIVYTSDLSDEVAPIEIPDAVNVTASYPIAPVAGGNQELAAAFIAFVRSPAGQSILESYGFIPALASG